MEKRQFEYVTSFGDIEYAIIIRESDIAKETVNDKLKKALLNDLSDKVYSGGETE
ncbi:MAG: hypothetical protein NC037_00135 [Bacteroides sp.]|nr:hypothetical protein [Bacillota bacterium]MCM1454926.1 hypothetical protein [Bacteroides sp.]